MSVAFSYAGIVGTRHPVTPDDLQNIRGYLDIEIDQGAIIVTGDASGIDKYAREWAEETGRALFELKAPWDILGSPFAAHARNEAIARIVDSLYAFPCKHSKGTHDTIRRFSSYGRHERGFTVECLREPK